MIARHDGMAESERPVVAFLGPEGSYTHQVSGLDFIIVTFLWVV